MTPAEVEEIKKKAKEVHDISMQYQLAHATFACNKLAGAAFKSHVETKRKELAQQAAKQNISEQEREKIRSEMKALNNPFRIYVEYVDIPEDGARVIWLELSNQMVIVMPKKLLDDAVDETTGWYKNPDAVKKLRKAMAHELGHIVLNIENIFASPGPAGPQKHADIETAAEIFAEESLRLRHERNKELRSKPALNDVF